jgi:hypothetical protein
MHVSFCKSIRLTWVLAYATIRASREWTRAGDNNMSIRGRVTFECDTKGCHAEYVIDAEDADLAEGGHSSVRAGFYAGDWVLDDDGLLHCPQCCEEGRERGDDDGREYGHPADARSER